MFVLSKQTVVGFINDEGKQRYVLATGVRMMAGAVAAVAAVRYHLNGTAEEKTEAQKASYAVAWLLLEHANDADVIKQFVAALLRMNAEELEELVQEIYD